MATTPRTASASERIDASRLSGAAASITSLIEILRSRTPFQAMIPQANSAAQSSAASYPSPMTSAIEIPMNAATEVNASERWCQASTRSAVLNVSRLIRVSRR